MFDKYGYAHKISGVYLLYKSGFSTFLTYSQVYFLVLA